MSGKWIKKPDITDIPYVNIVYVNMEEDPDVIKDYITKGYLVISSRYEDMFQEEYTYIAILEDERPMFCRI